MAPGPFPAGIPIAPEMLVPRIGETMLERGLLGKDGLQQALTYQASREAEGRPILLGQALLELGLVSRETLDEVITVQILQLQDALNDTNRQLEQHVQERTQDLQRALERLSELSQLKANFVANISHELRTPLTHLKGYLDLLSSEGLGPINNQQAHALNILLRAEERLENLIENLIQFSLVSRGELNLTIDPINLEDLIRENIQRLRNRADAKQISLSADLPEGLSMVRGDREKLGWVVLQLMDNALKFTPPGKKVWIKVFHEDGMVHVAIYDEGIGIPQDRLDEIFELFHQLDGSATRKYGGTGLGLAMVQQIVKAHGSEVYVASTKDQGSCFSFSLPAIEPSPITIATGGEQRITDNA